MRTFAEDADSLKWLFLDLNSYFASVEQQLTPSLRNRPIAVAPVMSDSTCAIAASYEAKAFGIKTGTPIWEAKEKCPDLVVVPARHDIYVRFHHRIVAAVNGVIPVARVESVDEMGCRLPDHLRKRGVALDLGRRVKAAILDSVGPCLRCSVGVAPNRFLAKVATELRKPDGLTAIGLGELPGPLLKLVPRDLPGIGANMERRLLRAGIVDLAGLWNLSPRDARRIWHGVAGDGFWHMLHGFDLPARETQRRTIGHSRVLDPDLRMTDRARLVARRLAVKAATRLRRMDHVAGSLAMSARDEAGQRYGGDFRLGPTQDNDAILAALDALWKRHVELAPFGFRGPRRLKKVSVVLYDLAPLADTTLDLFAQRRDAAAAPLGKVVDLVHAPKLGDTRRTLLSASLDTLNKRYGRDTVSVGVMSDKPGEGKRLDYLGAKVAFTRIPDIAEFAE
ncbi:MAG TPA: hypothetical protein VGO34_12810 [Alphaproteobacteria bacterium]|jgi:DNA polymerase-4